ncbi:MAG TPA: DUF4388 domain-containing protein, partial [Thermoanaerobaculia bacterium]|nr:DUF4388 domain-containing protein [Thermoanaerobaculia bacterium]
HPATGVLAFSRPDQRVRVEILDGTVVGVFTSDPSFDTAEVLVRAGKLDPGVLEERRPTAGRDRARAAREQGLLTERDWRWGEKIRAVEVLSDLLGWLEGSYSFDPSERPEPGEFRLGIERLLLELFLRSRDREFIHGSLGATDAPLQRSSDFEETFPTLGLTADARLVVAAIDGRATAAEISRRVPPDPFSVEKLLAALTILGLVHPEYAAETPVRQAVERAPEPPGQAAAPELEPERPREPLTPPMPAEAPPPSEKAEPDIPTPAREPEARAFEAPAPVESPLELPLPAPGAAPEPEIVTSWEQVPPEPMDQPLAMPEPPELLRPSRSGLGSLWILVILAIAVAALLFFRSREGRNALPGPQSLPSPAAGARSPGVAAGSFSIPAATAVVAAAPRATEPPPTPASAAAAPTPKRPPSPHPTILSEQPATGAVAPPRDRRLWIARAENDLRRLARDRRTRYSIQLELVCELPSLEEAWRYDRRGAMWLLAAPYGGRECFRVFWGRFSTIDQARTAKAEVPRFFFTPRNQPAVVSTRALLP